MRPADEVAGSAALNAVGSELNAGDPEGSPQTSLWGTRPGATRSRCGLDAGRRTPALAEWVRGPVLARKLFDLVAVGVREPEECPVEAAGEVRGRAPEPNPGEEMAPGAEEADPARR